LGRCHSISLEAFQTAALHANVRNKIERDLLFRGEPEGGKQLKFEQTAQARLCQAKNLGGFSLENKMF